MSKPSSPRQRAVRGSVMAGVLAMLVRQKVVEAYEFQKQLKVSKKALSVTLARLLEKKLIQRIARGMYTLRG
jgi:DNA-binding HxlR family transcriptional regulator